VNSSFLAEPHCEVWKTTCGSSSKRFAASGTRGSVFFGSEAIDLKWQIPCHKPSPKTDQNGVYTGGSESLGDVCVTMVVSIVE